MIFRFTDCVLNVDDFTLYADNIEKKIEPHVFDLILYLIINRDRLVTREELFKNLWAGREVCDATLSNTIKCARAALGDDGERQCIIKTTRGRGYQFIAKVEVTSTKNQDRRKQETSGEIFKRIFANIPYKTTLLRVAILISLVPILIIGYQTCFVDKVMMSIERTDSNPSENSIAVLPFHIHGEFSEKMHIIEGIHDDLLVEISKVSSVRSIARPAVMAYVDSHKSIGEIGAELDVSIILHGSIQMADRQVRINVRLINVLSNENIWAESYTKELTDNNAFTIQEELAKSISAKIETLFE